jgi:hypothetical protein
MATTFKRVVVPVLFTATLLGMLCAIMLPAAQSKREGAAQAESRPGSTSASLPPVSADGEGARGVPADGDVRYLTALQIETQDGQPLDRKIIYEAQIALVVDDLGTTESSVVALLDEFDGYVAESNLAGRQGDQLTGTWRVRIPVERFEEFLGALAKLGVTEHRQQTAQDVSEEFVDLEARIANQKKLEERIVALLDQTNDKIADVIEVEQQLARVRGEIEQMEGRLRYLTNRTELTTVSITAREERDYVPPEAPTFTTRITDAWGDSLAGIVEFGQRLTIAAVAAAPWLAMLAVVLGPAAWSLSRRRKSAVVVATR